MERSALGFLGDKVGSFVTVQQLQGHLSKLSMSTDLPHSAAASRPTNSMGFSSTQSPSSTADISTTIAGISNSTTGAITLEPQATGDTYLVKKNPPRAGALAPGQSKEWYSLGGNGSMPILDKTLTLFSNNAIVDLVCRDSIFWGQPRNRRLRAAAEIIRAKLRALGDYGGTSTSTSSRPAAPRCEIIPKIRPGRAKSFKFPKISSNL